MEDCERVEEIGMEGCERVMIKVLMKGRNERMIHDDLMMKHQRNEMKSEQSVEIVKHPSIKRGKTVFMKIKTME